MKTGFTLFTFLVFMSFYSISQSLQYSYDNIGRLIQILYPDSSSIKYTYDNMGNRISSKVQDPCSNKPKPIITASGPTSFCQGGWVSLTSTPGTKYLWSSGDTTQSIIVTSSGSYTVTRLDNYQCSKTSTPIIVIVHPKYTQTLAHTMCIGETYQWNGMTLSSAGIYHDNHQTIHGCDSNFTLNLYVKLVYAFNETHSICNGSTYSWHGQILSSPGLYHDYHQSIYGCDSNFTLNLNILPTYTFSESHSICAGSTYYWHGLILSSAGVYHDNHQTVNGCDSSYALYLNVNPSFSFSETDAACDGTTYSWHGLSLSFPGIYHANYQSTSGCDSSYTLNLNFHPVYVYSQVQSICNGDTLPWHGLNLTYAGIYHANFLTSNGCDSSYTLSLTVDSTPITPVISYYQGQLTSTSSAGNQWYLNGALIPGAINQYYQPIQNGYYYAIVTYNGCPSYPSNTLTWTVGIDESEKCIFLVYPNPTNGRLEILYNGDQAEYYTITLVNNLGAALAEINNILFTGKKPLELDFHDKPSGIYALILKSTNNQLIRKLLITR